MSDLKFYTYDLEVFPNVFTFAGKFLGANEVQTFEISFRMNQKSELLQWLSYLESLGVHMVGYNSLGFDYPILHLLLTNPHLFDEFKAAQMCQNIINLPYGAPKNFLVRKSDRIIPQIDLFKLNHFDNSNKRTSLKALEFAMRLQSVEDLPFPIRGLTFEEIDTLISYNHWDVQATEMFLKHCIHLIKMRKELLDNGVLSGDVLNFSDVKIGTEYLVSKLGRGACFFGNKPRQSIRNQIRFNEIILPKIFYRSDEFTKVLDWFKQQVYTVKGENDIKLITPLAGLEFVFGVGGVHASVEAKAFKATDTHMLIDIDVAGMYPAVSLANGFYPEHLGKEFLAVYGQLQIDRRQYPKGTSMNKTLKLAGNGAFGNSNNEWSCFLDPRFLYSITVNGQLQLLQLIENLSRIPGLKLIQANTDGTTLYMPRDIYWLFKIWKEDWEKMTGLVLEEVEYKSMFVRDVNNYLAVTTEGKIKRKGAYAYPETWADYEGNWNKDYSNLIIQKVAEQMLIHGHPPESIIKLATDPFDFMLRYKTTGGAQVMMGEQKCSKTVRYYVSHAGSLMKKVAPPKGPIGAYKRANKLKDSFYNRILSEIPEGSWDSRIHTKNKSKYETVITNIESGWLVKECNDASKFDWSDLNYNYYLDKINKLRIGDSDGRV